MDAKSPLVVKFLQFIDEVISNGLSDVHITSGDFPFIRTPDREVTPVSSFGRISFDELIGLILFMKPDINTEEIINLQTGKNFIYENAGTRFRINVSRNEEGIAIAMRTIRKKIPTVEGIGLKGVMLDLLQKDRGLILITGGTGSGKTTTLVAMIDYLNKHFHKHIITVEDPIEYLMKNEKSLIHQKQVGKHVSTFDQAIRDAMREDPDILMVGEMRDIDTISAVLTLAETGHLVLSTLHTNDVVQTFDRLIYAFPAAMQSQVRVQLAMTLVAVVGQIILPSIDGKTSVVAREIFINGEATRNIIMDGNITHLYSAIETGKHEGMILMQQSLNDLHATGQISLNTLEEFVKDKKMLDEYLEKSKRSVPSDTDG